jgi:hypothetical protein
MCKIVPLFNGEASLLDFEPIRNPYKERFSNDVLPCIDRGIRYVGVVLNKGPCLSCYVDQGICTLNHTVYCHVPYDLISGIYTTYRNMPFALFNAMYDEWYISLHFKSLKRQLKRRNLRIDVNAEAVLTAHI